ncbi:MAG: prefoldin subunit beta [Promethearchaeota archaeon]
MSNQIPRALQEEIRQFQSLGQQLDVLTQQIFTLETSIKEKEKTLEELEKSPEDVVVYRHIGGILIKSERNKVIEALKDEKLTLEMRKKTLERNEANLKKKFNEMKADLTQKLKK